MKSFVYLVLLMTQLALGKVSLRSEKALKTQIFEDKIVAELASGHHFNEKAPNGAQLGADFKAPSLFEKQKIEIPLPKEIKENGTAYFYVCDDEVTYCEVHSRALGKGKATLMAQQKKSNLQQKHGFYQNAFNEVMAMANVLSEQPLHKMGQSLSQRVV